jgi:hypothetical protein
MRQGQTSACEHARESVLQCVSVCARERVRESLVQSFSALFFSSQFENTCILQSHGPRTTVLRLLHCGAWIPTFQVEPVG